MVYDVEWWAGESEKGPDEWIDHKEFADQTEAMRFAWDRMEEGFATKMFRR